MKRVFIAIVLLIGIPSLYASNKLPIEYQIQKKYQRMKIMLNGEVRWNVSRSENTFNITLMGNEQNFIIKNINYNFRDGIIKKFNYQSILEGTKKLTVELRSGVTDYHIYQDEALRNLYIEFYPDGATKYQIAKNIPGKKTLKDAKKVNSAPQQKQNVVNIPQIVLDQVDQIEEQPKKVSEEKDAPIFEQPKTSASSSAALWLILVSVSFLLTGGGFTVYAFLKRRPIKIVKKTEQKENTIAVPDFRSYVEKSSETIATPVYGKGIVIADEDPVALSQSIEFAEQYLRSQGELDLQQRLENMSSRSTQKKMDVELPLLKRKDPALLAQKLGLSVGELELVTRLQKFHKQHSTEVL